VTCGPAADGSVSTQLTTSALAPGRPGGGAVVLHPVVVPGGLGAHKWRDRRLLEAVVEQGGGVPLLVDLDGEVLEAAHANVFLAVGDLLLTPPLDGRLLPGTVRADLIAATRRAGGELREERLTLDRLAAGDAILLTSSIRGVHAARLDGQAEPPAELARRLDASLGGVPYLVSSEPAEREPVDTIAGTGGRSSSTRIT
jgi:para-aminobenzoate synthetase / 4-amino-4-deoxychorismate lyase